MADKDDEFLDADEGGGGDAGAKEGKAKSPFASAMLMQILKWLLIIGGGIALMVTIAWIVTTAMLSGNQQNAEGAMATPEYSTKPADGDLYGAIPELRGETKEEAGQPARMYIIKLYIQYTKDDKELQNDLIKRTVQIQDVLLTWFSKQSGDYLKDINNREAIRETVKQQINAQLIRPVVNIYFTKYEIPSI